MNGDERTALGHVATGAVVFHVGTWGGPAGYRWCGEDGAAAGALPVWEAGILDRMAGRGLVAVERRSGPLERKVVLTEAGWEALRVVS